MPRRNKKKKASRWIPLEDLEDEDIDRLILREILDNPAEKYIDEEEDDSAQYLEKFIDQSGRRYLEFDSRIIRQIPKLHKQY